MLYCKIPLVCVGPLGDMQLTQGVFPIYFEWEWWLQTTGLHFLWGTIKVHLRIKKWLQEIISLDVSLLPFYNIMLLLFSFSFSNWWWLFIVITTHCDDLHPPSATTILPWNAHNLPLNVPWAMQYLITREPITAAFISPFHELLHCVCIPVILLILFVPINQKIDYSLIVYVSFTRLFCYVWFADCFVAWFIWIVTISFILCLILICLVLRNMCTTCTLCAWIQ